MYIIADKLKELKFEDDFFIQILGKKVPEFEAEFKSVGGALIYTKVERE